MRIALKLCLLIVATSAPAGSIAYAQTPTVEITNEATGQPCPDATSSSSGGCLLHMSGEVALSEHLFGLEALFSNCLVEYQVRIGGDGDGWIYNWGVADHPGVNNCVLPCSGASPIRVEETAASTEALVYSVCHRRQTDGRTVSCPISQPVVDTGDHSYVATATDLRGTVATSPQCEVDGQLTFEGTGIEIAHL
jgi:hypothetical protein